mgnify:CR=1 FL=1
MNILAHSYLSGQSEEIKVGNFIGDYVKGHDYLKYKSEISKGIVLHRDIDNFTDNHVLVKKSIKRLRYDFRKYAGIIVDIFYDHFLCMSWSTYSSCNLQKYIDTLYKILLAHIQETPVEVQDFLPRFIKNDWLSYYDNIDGIAFVLDKMSQNTSLPRNTDKAIEILKLHYDDFAAEFNVFFPELIQFVKTRHGIQIS